MNENVHFLIHNVIEVLASCCILHDNVNHFGGLNDFIHLSDGWMSYNFEEMQFTRNSFNIGDVFDFLLF